MIVMQMTMVTSDGDADYSGDESNDDADYNDD